MKIKHTEVNGFIVVVCENRFLMKLISSTQLIKTAMLIARATAIK